MLAMPFQLSKGLITSAVISALSIVSMPAFSESPQNIHQICAKSPQACLKDIEGHLSQQTFESRIWFQYKMYQLEALFQLVEFERLKREVEPWVERDDIPLKFQISVLIYYAKTISSQGQRALAIQYMNKAIDTINEVKSVAYDPMLVVQVANGLNYLGENQQGYDLLKPLVKKYRNRPMAKFKHELFENLGHFAIRLGKKQEHLAYRLQALEWAREVGNDNQTAISLYNVARAHQMLEDYERAYHYFELAEKMNALGASDQNLINYRRAEMAYAMDDLANAKRYLALVERSTEFDSYNEMFDNFEQKLLSAK